MGKVLALDFGLKRTGLAISDDAKMFAFGLETVDSSKLMEEIKKLTSELQDTLRLNWNGDVTVVAGSDRGFYKFQYIETY